MIINPVLRKTERIGSLAIGVGAIAYAFLGDHDQAWSRALLVLLGLAFAVGGICGT